MVANDLTPEAVKDPQTEIAFPDSVVSMFKGELGFPPDGFPADLTRKILKGRAPISGRAAAAMPAADLEAKRAEAQEACGREVNDNDLASYLMYPKVFRAFAEHERDHDDVSVLPTPVFFYGLKDHEEAAIEIEHGKTIVIALQGSAEVDEEGKVRVFFELNGQPRSLRVTKAGAAAAGAQRQQAEEGNALHIGAPMPGAISTVSVTPGQSVKKGDPLVSIEAMKMETMLRAERDLTVSAVHVKSGDAVAAKDLMLEVSY
jgi:pyruvate carboxylase